MSDNEETKSSLSNLLDGEASQPEQAETAPGPRETEPEPKDQGDKLAASEPPADAEDKDDNSPLVPRKALIEERKKRQDYERKLAEFEAKLAQMSAPKPQPQPQQQFQMPERPDPWTDPEGALRWEQQQREVALYETRVVMSEELMSQKPDYEEAKAVFIQAAQQDPALAQKLVRHPMPAKFVYEEGKKLKALSEIGNDPASYRERLEAEIRERLMAEMQANPSVPATPRAPAPKSLAGTPNQVPRDQKGRFAPSGPTPLEDIIG